MTLFALPALADNYIWLLAGASGSALVVDPGEAAPVEAALLSSGLRLTSILLTHHHPDHIGGAAELAARHGATIHAPRSGSRWPGDDMAGRVAAAPESG